MDWNAHFTIAIMFALYIVMILAITGGLICMVVKVGNIPLIPKIVMVIGVILVLGFCWMLAIDCQREVKVGRKMLTEKIEHEKDRNQQEKRERM